MFDIFFVILFFLELQFVLSMFTLSFLCITSKSRITISFVFLINSFVSSDISYSSSCSSFFFAFIRITFFVIFIVFLPSIISFVEIALFLNFYF